MIKRWKIWRKCSLLFLDKRGEIDIEKIKCERCGQTLMLADYVKGEIKCPRCKKVNRLDIKKTESRATP